MNNDPKTFDDLSEIEKEIILEIRKGNKKLEEFIKGI